MKLEAFKCDRAGCETESNQLLEGEVPQGWLCVSRWGHSEGEDMVLHYCSWNCALLGMNHHADREEAEEAGAT